MIIKRILRPSFPSFKIPHFQNEAKWKIFHMKTSFIWTTREILFSRLFWFCVLLYPYAWWLAEKYRATSSINQIINPIVTYSRIFPAFSSRYKGFRRTDCKCKGLTKTLHVGTGLAVENKRNTSDSLMLHFNWNFPPLKRVGCNLVCFK